LPSSPSWSPLVSSLFTLLYKVLETLGFVRSEFDHALFILNRTWGTTLVHCLLTMHVDDGLGSCNPGNFLSFIKGEIGKQFGIEDLGPLIHSGHTIRTRLPHERDLDLSGDTTHILQLKTSRDVNISSALCYSRNLILGRTSPSQSHSFLNFARRCFLDTAPFLIVVYVISTAQNIFG